jgi:two-component system, OmpR family, sensor kinase
MNLFRSVGSRLGLALLVVLVGAFAIVYLALVPTLERTFVDSKLDQLQQSGELLQEQFPGDDVAWADFVQQAAETTNARVAILEPVLETPEPAMKVAADSRQVGPSDLTNDPIALQAAETSVIQRGTVSRGGEDLAEVGVPIVATGPVLLLSDSLEETLANVDLVRRRLLLAGLLALAIALAVGYAAARMFARRLRRLERAADRISSGRFDQPIADSGRDEVGELAEAFERMRGRLAQLEHARREFIANASHELRTPLFSLGGFLELLTDEELDDETRLEFLRTMREQVERLTKLATDLLDLSRLDAGRVQVERTELDLATVARALCSEFEPLARSGERPIDTAVDGPVEAVGDEQRTLQIGRIMLENALLHTPPGTPVHVRAAVRNGRAELTVEDEGQGIPDEHEEQVFERFYRLEGGVASGSGLGLAIARELAELMGGTIELDSRPGRTQFALILPSAGGMS